MPAQPSFQQAIEISAGWLGLWENGELSDEVLADRVAELLASRDGARGFFVVSLAGDSALMDRLPEPLVLQLRLAGEGVVDLTARNLVMSTAMALHHGRNGDPGQQAGSLRVAARAGELLRQLEPARVKQRLEPLLAAALRPLQPAAAAVSAPPDGPADPVAEDLAFLARWGYDADQRQAIAAAIEAVAD
ncbi:MAG: hypothetical protein VKI83_08290 [Synechococcaceae cyanobacterium]|nr:hypothetical protein [Synechococcaceae cyanobacterium]